MGSVESGVSSPTRFRGRISASRKISCILLMPCACPRPLNVFAVSWQLHISFHSHIQSSHDTNQVFDWMIEWKSVFNCQPSEWRTVSHWSILTVLETDG